MIVNRQFRADMSTYVFQLSQCILAQDFQFMKVSVTVQDLEIITECSYFTMSHFLLLSHMPCLICMHPLLMSNGFPSCSDTCLSIGVREKPCPMYFAAHSTTLSHFLKRIKNESVSSLTMALQCILEMSRTPKSEMSHEL